MSQVAKVIFLSGKKVNLRPLMRSDIPTLTRWINDSEVREFVLSTFPKTEKDEEEWFNEIGTDEHNIVLAIETKEGVFIGLMGIHNIRWIEQLATTGALIGEKDYWGKGYGTDAKMILLDYAFNALNMRKICSRVISFNKRSLHYSLHCGYRVEGRRRKEVYKKGKFWDVIELGVFKDEWMPYWREYKKAK